jgi:hypothetical protein
MGNDSPSDVHSTPPTPKAKKDEMPGIQEALENLSSITRMLRWASSLIVMSAAMALATLVGGVLAMKFFRNQDAMAPGAMLLYLSMSMSGSGLFFLFTWEQRRRRGKLFYEEISDEVEWRHRSLRSKQTVNSIVITSGSIIGGDSASGSKEPPAPKENGTPQTPEMGPTPSRKKLRRRPDLAIRIILREYLNSSTLPFGSGEWSGALYVCWYLVCLLAAVFGLSVYFTGF